ncbi:hypothetical protein BGZ65_001754, partial [Modicella reniformis]
MLTRSIVPSPKNALSLQQALELTNVYLENAYKTKDQDVALVLCHDAEASLFQAKVATKKFPNQLKDAEDQSLRDDIVSAYIDLGKLLEVHGYRVEAQTICKKAEKWGGNAQNLGRLARNSLPNSVVHSVKGTSDTTMGSSAGNASARNPKQLRDIATIPSNIFAVNVGPTTSEIKLPETDGRLTNTPQLACCLGLLQVSLSHDDILEPAARKWLQTIEKDNDEQDRLKMLATDVIRAFKRDEIKDDKVIAEVVYLAPVLDKDAFQDLLREFYSGINQSELLDVHQLEGLAQLVQGAGPGYLEADDLVKILELLSTRLRGTHQQSPRYIHRLTVAVSNVLDAMADTEVKDLDRVSLHEPLSTYLNELKGNSDPYLVYQAAYAYQALICVPDNESLWKAGLRRTGKVIQGFAGLVSAVKGLDLNKFIDGLEDIQQGFSGVTEAVRVVKTVYEGVSSLAQSGQSFMECLKEGFSFDRKCAWYSALRGADAFIRDGELAKFRSLVCEVPCRRDPAFQWGVCQRLGEIAADSKWDGDIRRGAISFLGEIYKNDDKGPTEHPLIVTVPALPSPSLLDRSQDRPDVEANLRQLRKHRLSERGNAVYIPPQAKANLQASNDARFPLMERVEEFLKSNQKVFLLMGDSGAGKSTFNRVLECNLWQAYKNNTGRIPLHINLPAIDKPEHDMVAKQLRKAEFTEPQIRELKFHRKFILICDGYDESQQTHNLYTSNRLSQPGEWDAQMIISCRSEYLGVDYRDRFQPTDRNKQSESSIFQEAVITPFKLDQVQDYIKQYVSLNQPLWQTKDYNRALEDIPTLKELVTNPFLMTLSLEVLPRMVDPSQQLSATRVTRVALYDQFVEHWLERGKKRLGEKDLNSQERSVFESLSDDGFIWHGLAFLKKLAVAIYKEQDGHPVVIYSHVKREQSWKDSFFSRDDEKKLLREACPLTRNGNQYRFIHRSILEYGLARAIFDPKDGEKRVSSESNLSRRGS